MYLNQLKVIFGVPLYKITMISKLHTVYLISSFVFARSLIYKYTLIFFEVDHESCSRFFTFDETPYKKKSIYSVMTNWNFHYAVSSEWLLKIERHK